MLNNDYLGTQPAANEPYIVFQMGHQIFATLVSEVRSIAEWQEPKAVPNLPPYYLGIVNILGEIFLVNDLRVKTGQEFSKDEKPVFLLVETSEGSTAVVVSKVLDVFDDLLNLKEKQIHLVQIKQLLSEESSQRSESC